MSELRPPGPPGLKYRLYLAGYAALLWCAMPLVWRYFRRRARGDELYGAHLDERRGAGAPFAADVWVHAVSLGEMTSAEPLVRRLLAQGTRVVTTHATPAGRRRAEAAFADEIAAGQLAVRYAPVDLPGYWRRFFRGVAPSVGLVMEMEFWPWMIEAAREAGVILCLANAQVPGRSFPRARRLAAVLGHPVARAAAVFAKSDPMAARFRALGAGDVRVVGETRFDIPPPEALLAAGRAGFAGRPVVTLASVVAGEEAVYVRALRDLLAGDEPPLVIWVPRAPERFALTAGMLAKEGFNVARRSEVFDDGLAPIGKLDGIEVLVGDSMGEMFFYLAPAGAVVVGGGFVESAAHNVIEPLAIGKPVITGPNVWTIEFPAVEAQKAGVLTICDAPDHLADLIRTATAEGAAAAEAFHAANAGASERIVAAVAPLLDEDRGG